MSDLISRQAAIDMCRKPCMRNADCSDFEMEIMMLPSAQLDTYWKEQCQSYEQTINKLRESLSAQPEIIRCKDCRYYNSEEKECLDLLGHGRRWEEDDFCSYGERNEVTE